DSAGPPRAPSPVDPRRAARPYDRAHALGLHGLADDARGIEACDPDAVGATARLLVELRGVFRKAKAEGGTLESLWRTGRSAGIWGRSLIVALVLVPQPAGAGACRCSG